MDILRLFSLTVRQSKTHFHQIAFERRAQFIFETVHYGTYCASNFDRKELEKKQRGPVKIDGGMTIVIGIMGIQIHDYSHNRKERLEIGWHGLKKKLCDLLRRLRFPLISNIEPCTTNHEALGYEGIDSAAFLILNQSMSFYLKPIEDREIYMSIIRWILEEDFRISFDLYCIINKRDVDKHDRMESLEKQSEIDWEGAKKRFKN